MSFDEGKVLKGYVDSEARVDRLRRANRHKALKSELAQEKEEEEFLRNQSRRAVAHARESAITDELKKQESEHIRKEKLAQLMRNQAPELRDLEAKLIAAKTAKERKSQIAEAKFTKTQNLQEEKQWGEVHYQQAKQYEADELDKKQRTQAGLRAQMEVQRKQIDDRQEVLQAAQDQYLREKGEVDAVVAKIQEQDYLDALAKVEKQRATKVEHEVFTAQRHQLQAGEKERYRQEEAAIKVHLEEQNKRKESGERLRREKEAIKAKILETQSSKIAAELAKKDELESLINDYYEEQQAAKLHLEAVAERDRKQKDKEMMLQANAEQMRLKQQVKEKEMAEEQIFRQQMMEKFAEDDRLDQVNRQKRMTLKAAHSAKVASLLEEKRRLRDEDREREEVLDQQGKKAEAERAALVQQERERLLRQYADVLQEVLPPGVLTSQGDMDIIRQGNSRSQRK